MLVKIILLIGLVKLLQSSKSAGLCAGIYGVIALIITFFVRENFTAALIAGILGGVLGFIYFWLLLKTEDSWLWWVILLVGFGIGIV